ncbi:MAG TPA: hypothetical protein VEI83_15410, partial [Acidimicrobiales bacterium]|nr:hypothetical protein [Acidimicrobiales bacterium]
IERTETVSAIDLAARAADAALDQAKGLRDRVERVSVVNMLTPVGPAPAARLARRLGIDPAVREVSTIGGNSPQTLVARAAAAIAAGDAEVVLVAGAEAQRSQRARRPEGGRVSGTPSEQHETVPDAVVGDDRPGVSDHELSAGLVAPVNIYALFESALARRAARDFASHRAALGRLMAPFTKVAATHPYAWFPHPRDPQALADVAPDNRLVSEPFTKRLCAVIGVDQGAAVVVTSLGAARSAGVADRAVFCWSSASAADVWFPTQRPDLARSPGIAAAVGSALAGAGLGVDDLDAFDLYSCFPCAVELAVDAIGITGDDPRGLTVTGGLPYFGGPGNNYTLHAIATMTERLRDHGGRGLVTGLGWYATKHAAGVYASEPPPRGYVSADTTDAQQAIDATAVPVVAGVDGGQARRAQVLGATIAFGPGGEPHAAPVIARLEDGRQLAADAAEGELAPIGSRNLAGAQIEVAGTPARYRVLAEAGA